MIELGDHSKKVIRMLFSEEDVEKVEEFLVENCAENLPFCDVNSPEEMEPIRLAALKYSDGSYLMLKHFVVRAKRDSRKLLIGEDFDEDLDVHVKWANGIDRPSLLSTPVRESCVGNKNLKNYSRPVRREGDGGCILLFMAFIFFTILAMIVFNWK